MVLRAPLLLKLAGAGLICRTAKSWSPVQKNQPTEKKKTTVLLVGFPRQLGLS
jgi:hypothetical protein